MRIKNIFDTTLEGDKVKNAMEHWIKHWITSQKMNLTLFRSFF